MFTRICSAGLTMMLGLACLITTYCAPMKTTMVSPTSISPERMSPTTVELPAAPTSTQIAPHRQQTTAVSPALTSTRATESKSTLTPMEEVKPMTLTIVYDNNAYDPKLQTDWGFACLIEWGDTTLLFDTGGDGALLLSNMTKLGFDPSEVDIVVLSHIHRDHTGGLSHFLAAGVQPLVYVPRAFPDDFKAEVQRQTELIEIDQAVEICNGVYTTGEMGSGIIEQALVLKTSKGLVVITGCAHPGVAEMVRRAKEVGEDEVNLVLGGFHLGQTSKARIGEIIAAFRQMGVQKVAPCHCTGDKAIGYFREAYSEDFIECGVGKVLIFDFDGDGNKEQSP